jgi:hypothetical protein
VTSVTKIIMLVYKITVASIMPITKQSIWKEIA